MKLIPVTVFVAGEKVEHYINLDYICSISPSMEVDDFDNFVESDSFVSLEFVSGLSLMVFSSYDDFIVRLTNIAKKSKNMDSFEED